MTHATSSNFANWLIERLGPGSSLIDAATGNAIGAEELPRRIAAYGAAFVAAGLRTGDRVLVGSALSPASALAYLGTMYAGLVAVPVDERTLSTSAPSLVEASGAKAVWSIRLFAVKSPANSRYRPFTAISARAFTIPSSLSLARKLTSQP